MLRRLLLGLLICQFALLCSSARALASEEANVRQLRAMAVEVSARGKVDDALNYFDSAIAQAEKAFGRDSSYVAEIYFDAGLVALRGDRYEKASKCLSRAVELNPNSPAARLRLAELYKKRGNLVAAKEHIQKVLDRDPGCLEARQQLAMTYQQEGNLAKATEQCYLLSVAIQGKDSIAQVAYTPPPPMVSAPPATPHAAVTTTIMPIRPSARSVASVQVKPVPQKVQLPKPQPRPQPRVQPNPQTKPQPKPQTKKAEAIRLAKAKQQQDKKKGKRAKPEVIAETGPSSSWGLQARMKSKAVLLTPIKGKPASAESDGAGKPKPVADAEVKPEVKAAVPKPTKQEDDSASSGGDEEGFGGTTSAPKATAKAKPVVVAAPKPQPVIIQAPKRPRGGMVPPPPPVVPTFMIAPPPAAMVAPPPKPKPKPVEKPKETTPEKHSSGGEDDSDFLLDWAGKKKGK